MKKYFNEERKMKNEELGRVRARESHWCNRPLRWLALRLRTFRNSFADDRRIRQRLRVLTFFILNFSFFIPLSANADADYVKSIKAQLELLNAYKTAENFADLRLWYLRNTQPKIFVDIETASNATDMGYFRLDFNAAGKLGKYRMLREEFGVK